MRRRGRGCALRLTSSTTPGPSLTGRLSSGLSPCNSPSSPPPSSSSSPSQSKTVLWVSSLVRSMVGLLKERNLMTTCARRAPERRVDLWGVVVCVCVCRREGGGVCLLDEAADGEAGGVELERRGRASADIALWLRRLEPHAEQQLVLLRAAEVAVAHAVAARVDACLAEVSSRRLHAAQHLEGLEDDEAGDDGVGGGDGVDDPPRDPLDLPPRLERDVEGCAAQVGGGSHKVHRVVVILAQGRGRSRAWAAGGLRRESGEWRVEREGGVPCRRRASQPPTRAG